MSTCAQCNKPLVIEISGDSEDSDTEMEASHANSTTETLPDDVKLPCACHFHWECLLDSYELARCPKCSHNIASGSESAPPGSSETQQILVDLNNEGGLQEQIDILPILKEEAYLRAYPEERKSRAFLEFCREGDHRAIADLLKSCPVEDPDPGARDINTEDQDEDGNSTPQNSPDEILRYQDPIGEMASGLHAAAANGHREVAWLLLLLASSYPELEMPALVFQEAAALGVMREWQEGKVDIRSLKDAQGRSAEDVAREVGVIWTGWFGNGRLAMP